MGAERCALAIHMFCGIFATPHPSHASHTHQNQRSAEDHKRRSVKRRVCCTSTGYRSRLRCGDRFSGKTSALSAAAGRVRRGLTGGGGPEASCVNYSCASRANGGAPPTWRRNLRCEVRPARVRTNSQQLVGYDVIDAMVGIRPCENLHLVGSHGRGPRALL